MVVPEDPALELKERVVIKTSTMMEVVLEELQLSGKCKDSGTAYIDWEGLKANRLLVMY